MKTEEEIYQMLFKVQETKAFHYNLYRTSMDGGVMRYHKSVIDDIDIEIRVLKNVLGLK